LHDRFSESLFAIFQTDDPAPGHDPKTRETSFSERTVLKLQRPAAIRRPDVTGTVPVIERRDGRHPKLENHGRIAGC
jgi:hypothetical protein